MKNDSISTAQCKSILRSIPKVDEILHQEIIEQNAVDFPRAILMESIHETLNQLRQSILDGKILSVQINSLCGQIITSAQKKHTLSLRAVINATGIVLHTNLGRARLSNAAVKAVVNIAQDYNTLEYNLEKGTRGSRYDHVEQLITKLTGAEDALVVNNNAAAVMLILSTMAKGKEVVVSRGELVEIGGAFRVPDIMQQSGGTLVEVGTTNKTHPKDYINAITPDTGAFLKVHTSNFKIMGFTEEVELEELAKLGHKQKIPVIYDLGSGSMIRLEDYGIMDEPNVLESMKSGADIISFSGDKLLGGPQAGIIIGKHRYIEAMKKNPLTRAFRIDKLTLAALEATLREYLEPAQAMFDNPTLYSITATLESLRPKAEALLALMNDCQDDYTAELTEDFSQVGGGSVPTQMIPSLVIAVTPKHVTLDELELALRQADLPIIARINKGRMLFDLRTLDEKHFKYIAQTVAEKSR